ncbi:MAG: NACHT domain-containing protein [Cyanobacteria bacterium P01_D01_bin.156]
MPSDREFEINDATVKDTNVVQGDSNRTVQGQGNQAIIGDNNVLASTVVIQQTSPEKRPRLERQLLAQVENEVKDRLRQSLHNQIFIELGKQQTPEQVSRPWDAEVKIGNREPEAIPNDKSIMDVFCREDIAGKLLILGHPGAGKTTTLVELAKALVEQAGQTVDLPIPVLFNLSSWQDDKQPIAQWLVKELKTKYGVRETIGKTLLDEQNLLPLLDGLDELTSQRQEPCAKAINSWLKSEERANQVVICSRLQEYETYSTVLELNGAICLQPLKLDQVREYLQQSGHPRIWDVVSQESELLELLSVPLWLSVLTLAYSRLDPNHWQKSATSQERLTMLLDAYISSRLHGRLASDYYKPNQMPTAKQTRQWLVWLAQTIEQDEFLVEKLQPTLLTTARNQWQMRLLVIMAVGAIIVVTLAIILGPAATSSSAVFVQFSLSLGMAWALIRSLKPIDTVEVLKISFSANVLKVFLEKLTIATVLGLILGLVAGASLSLMVGGLFYVIILWGVIWGLITGLPWGLIWGLIESLKADIQTQVKPNQGILNSGRNVLVLICLVLPIAVIIRIWLPSALNLVDISWTQLDEEQIFAIAHILMTILLLKTIDQGGGEAYLRHYALRFVLARSGKLPYLYVNFLNYCTERLLLQRIGGRFRFLHRTLQEHFAAMPLEDYDQGMKR